MTNFIPIFPLGVVLYPGEDLNLHIFEPRYKQLIQESNELKKPFGIPTVLDNKVQEFGVLAEITEISSVHENGEMDIRTRGIRIFRILELIHEIPDKLYGGAIVNYPENSEQRSPTQMKRIMESVRELHQLLKVTKDFKKADEDLISYDIAHHVGLSLAEEYELLNLLDERQRIEYLKRHLTKVLPLINGMELLKEKIKLNGHFKSLTGLDL